MGIITLTSSTGARDTTSDVEVVITDHTGTLVNPVTVYDYETIMTHTSKNFVVYPIAQKAKMGNYCKGCENTLHCLTSRKIVPRVCAKCKRRYIAEAAFSHFQHLWVPITCEGFNWSHPETDDCKECWGKLFTDTLKK